MNDVAILIPFKNINTHRLSNLFYVIEYYSFYMPEAKILVIEQNTNTDFSNLKVQHHLSTLKETLFCRGFLFNEGYNLLPSKYYIMADGDCLPDPELLQGFSKLHPKLEDTYIVPHSLVKYLSPESTAEVLKNRLLTGFDSLETTGHHRTVGGVTIIKGENLYKMEGYGHNFVGWGGEDDDLYNRCYASGLVKVERLPNSMYHLWHPSSVFHGHPIEEMLIKIKNMPPKILTKHEN
jgi:hypothetical protein